MVLIADLEFELFDIFEEYSIKSVIENIEFIMKREKLWNEGYSIVFPVGALDYLRKETKKDSGFYQKDFEVFAKDGNTILFYGTAYGTISVNEIIDMTIELKRDKNLKCYECGKFLEVPCEYLGRFCVYTVEVTKRN